jgi:hypothetical protein
MAAMTSRATEEYEKFDVSEPDLRLDSNVEL